MRTKAVVKCFGEKNRKQDLGRKLDLARRRIQEAPVLDCRLKIVHRLDAKALVYLESKPYIEWHGPSLLKLA